MARLSQDGPHQLSICIFGDRGDPAIAKREHPAIGIRVFAAIAGDVFTLPLNRNHVAFGNHVQRMAFARRQQHSAQRRDQIAQDLALSPIGLGPTRAADHGPFGIVGQGIQEGLAIAPRRFAEDVFQALLRGVDFGGVHFSAPNDPERNATAFPPAAIDRRSNEPVRARRSNCP